jgi:hypothetical protein
MAEKRQRKTAPLFEKTNGYKRDINISAKLLYEAIAAPPEKLTDAQLYMGAPSPIMTPAELRGNTGIPCNPAAPPAAPL